MRKLLLLLPLLALLSIGAAPPDAPAPAPDFTLPGVDGNSYSLANYRGKYVVLEWTNYDCPFVRKHYGSSNMQNLQKRYTEKGVVWLSINSSAPGKQGNFTPEVIREKMAERGASPTAYLLDPAGTVGRLYGARTSPHMFVINPEGQVIYQGAIDDKRSSDPADIPGALNYVAQALDQAMAGEPVSVAAMQPYGCGVKYAD